MTDLTNSDQNINTLRDYARVLFKHWGVIVLCVLIVSSIAFVGVSFQTPYYEASVKMLVSGSKQVDAPYYKELMPGGQTQASLTQTEIATSDPVLQRVVTALRLDQKPDNYEERFASPLKNKWVRLQAKMRKTKMEELSQIEQAVFKNRRALEDLRRSIKVAPIKDTNIFVITIRDLDRYGAAVIANVVSRSYIIFDLEQQMAELQLKYGDKHPVVVQLNDNIRRMRQSLNGKIMPNTDAIGPASVKIIQQANIPLEATGSRKAMMLIVAFLASVFLGIILSFIFEYMDQTVKSAREIERVLGIPFLGSLSKLKRRRDMFVKGVLHKNTPRKNIKEFKALADQVHLLMTTRPFKTLYIASSDSKDGESFIISNLAYHMAEHGIKKVLIVDANFRSGIMPKLFGLSGEQGIVDAVTGQAKLTEVVHAIGPRLFVLPAGKTTVNPLTFLDSAKMRQVLDELKKHFDLILISCAPLNAYQDGYLLSTMVDASIFVVTENETRRQVAQQEISGFKEHNAVVLGGILNGRTYPIPKFIYSRL